MNGGSPCEGLPPLLGALLDIVTAYEKKWQKKAKEKIKELLSVNCLVKGAKSHKIFVRCHLALTVLEAENSPLTKPFSFC